jgi:heterodisulfide reductase subunit C
MSNSKFTAKQTILLIYYLSPIIASLIYWFEEPTPLILSGDDFLFNLMNRFGSILGIFGFVWMCFNVLIMCKFKLIEENFSLEGIIKFHSRMAALAFGLSIIHYPMSRIGRLIATFPPFLIRTGTISFMVFFTFMALGLIFMSNHLIKKGNFRAFFYEINFRYNVNKALHNLLLLGVVVVFVHTTLSFTVASSLLMRIVYSFFTLITVIGWVYHKVIRRFLGESDPYAYRKALWDDLDSKDNHKKDKAWALEVIKNNPSLYTCMQCGSCTATCPVSDVTKGDFNPRKLIKSLELGSKDKIFMDKESDVWNCTNCYSCDEICPQGVKLSEIFYFIKNRLAEQKGAADGYLSEAEAVYNFGVSIPLQSGIQKRREKLELPSRPEYDLQEIQDLMNITGLNQLVVKDKEDI